MNAGAAARLAVASLVLCATLARAAEPIGASRSRQQRTTAAAAGDACGAAERATAARARRPSRAVLVLPIIGLVLLPLALPLPDRRVREPAAATAVPPVGSVSAAPSAAPSN